jgi:hypothetical protein
LLLTARGSSKQYVSAHWVCLSVVLPG